MNGHNRRTEEKQHHIKRIAAALFSRYGIAHISIDEIAESAQVSKVTIYKYFTNKSGLFREVIKMIFEEQFNAVDRIIHSTVSFKEKLEKIIKIKADSISHGGHDFVREIISANYDTGQEIMSDYMIKIRDLMFEFFNEGKRDGCIDKKITNDTIYHYIEIFNAGIQVKLEEGNISLLQKHMFKDLIYLFFFGIIQKKI